MTIPAQQDFSTVVHELDDNEFGRWHLMSESIGATLLPVLEDLVTSLPSSTVAMVCTADGFNLCALGLDESQVDRVSAMASSLLSVAAVATAAAGGTEEQLDLLTLSHGDHTTVVASIGELPLGPALLWVTGRQESLGAIIYRTRESAARMRHAFSG